MSTPHSSHPALVVLLGLRCVGTTGRDRLADAVRLSPGIVESELIDLACAGLVTYAPGDLGGWSITDAGRAQVLSRLSRELDEADARDAIAQAYERFCALNPELLEVCTAWQLRGSEPAPVLNDHTDHAYDTRVLRRLMLVDRRGQEVCSELAAVLARYQPYADRLSLALDRVMSGQPGYVADRLDSYHTVWFQLHEDLLATLGIPRW